ncbi:MAG: hypothetical protein ACREQY_12765, partial [Candidatus Binatia bacterium]
EEPELEAQIEEESEEMADSGREGESGTMSATSAGPPSADAVRELFAGVAVRRRDDGSIAIEARPESAQTLVSLFEGMAGLLRQATERPSQVPLSRKVAPVVPPT